jgi:hypothetical protein
LVFPVTLPKDELVGLKLLDEGVLGRRGEDRRTVRIRDGEVLRRVSRAVVGELLQDHRVSIHGPKLTLTAAVVEIAVLADACVIVVGDDAASGAGLPLGDSADLPATEHPGSQAGLTAEKRQFVEVADDQHVADVEERVAPHAGRIVGVGDDVALMRSTVLAVSQRVSRAE